MHITKNDLQNMHRKRRLNIVNSLSGLKPAILIGSISEKKIPNLAIFSSVFHVGSNPALIGFIQRPVEEVPRNTYQNILKTGSYTINHIHESFIEKAHQTAAKFRDDVSEFDKVALTAEYLSNFEAPFVKESQIKMAMKLVENIQIQANKTKLIIGEIQHIVVPDIVLSNEGYVDYSKLDGVSISGLNSYYRVEKISDLPFV